MLTLEILSEWLAGRPLQVPHRTSIRSGLTFAAVGSVMSSSYANRYRILPVAVTPEVVTVATSEPFVRSWIPSCRSCCAAGLNWCLPIPLDVKALRCRVLRTGAIGTPRAGKSSRTTRAPFHRSNNWFKLAQAGGATPDANDRHIVRIVDWLWQYAFEQRASDIHIEPRRIPALSAFASTACCIRSTRSQAVTMTAMVSRIKLLAGWKSSRNGDRRTAVSRRSRPMALKLSCG